ncbi:MAG: class Ib ribonucleoside-diphosphate reductase assembly flavoprotein NrdI [Brevinema sp.]
MTFIYYDSHTGNVERFVNKLKTFNPTFICVKITADLVIDQPGHLITYTTKIGEIPKVTDAFLLNSHNSKYILTISSSGNRNWGVNFALASHIISDQFDIPVALKFELSGTKQDVANYIEQINYLEICHA